MVMGRCDAEDHETDEKQTQKSKHNGATTMLSHTVLTIFGLVAAFAARWVLSFKTRVANMIDDELPPLYTMTCLPFHIGTVTLPTVHPPVGILFF